MPVRYERTPLVEAVFDVFFEGGVLSSGDRIALRQELSELLKGDMDEVVLPPSVEVVLPTSGEGEFKVGAPIRRERFWRTDRTALVQFDAGMCAYNVLPPYTNFVDYLPEMQRALEAFLSRTRPKAVVLLGQRYINRVVLPPGADPADYFSVYPRLTTGSGDRAFALQVEAARQAGGQVLLQLGFERRHQDGSSSFLLDLYARSFEKLNVAADWAGILGWHQSVHEHVKEAFELSLTELGRTFLGRSERS